MQPRPNLSAVIAEQLRTCFAEGTLGVHCSAYAVAIRTAPPAPVESKSFGEIKAMFRDE